MKYTLVLLTFCLAQLGHGRYVKNDKCKLDAYLPTPDSQCCGIDITTTYSIFGGQGAGLRQYPWLALIESRDDEKKRWKTDCTGFLISDRYVVSAAHCFMKLPAVNVILGEYDLEQIGIDCVIENDELDCTDGELRIAIDEIVVHEKYSNITYSNDIALIRLSEAAPYTDYIRPICLPTSDITTYATEDVTFTSAGWGFNYQGEINGTYITKSPSIKQTVRLPYFAGQPKFFLPKNHFMAGGEAGKDTCHGDSGGPLMDESYGVFQAVGIVSFGNFACGTEGHPGYYTNVFRYMDWINGKIEKLERSSEVQY